MTRKEWLDRLNVLASKKIMRWHVVPLNCTRSISDAWKLVEAMEAEWDVEIFRYHDVHDDWRNAWVCKIGELVDHDPFWHAHAPTAPLAITLASLRAVGCEIPEEPTDG